MTAVVNEDAARLLEKIRYRMPILQMCQGIHTVDRHWLSP